MVYRVVYRGHPLERALIHGHSSEINPMGVHGFNGFTFNGCPWFYFGHPPEINSMGVHSRPKFGGLNLSLCS